MYSNPSIFKMAAKFKMVKYIVIIDFVLHIIMLIFYIGLDCMNNNFIMLCFICC